MKTNKEQIYEFIRLHRTAGESEGVTTQYLADALGMQRTNVSAALGQLVQEGRLHKENGRPVLYRLRDAGEDSAGAFKNLVGYDGSLKHSVQLARAAVAYPQRGMNTLLKGKEGTGKNLFAHVMYKAAVEQNLLPPEAPFLEFACADYAGESKAADRAVFGEGEEKGALAKAGGGVLFFDNIQLLTAEVRRKLLNEVAEAEREGRLPELPVIIVSCEESSYDAASAFGSRMPVTIELPALAKRPLAERFSLVKQFLILEAARTRRTIRVESELLDCLLLFDCEKNIWTLKTLIKQACMNAYLREYAEKGDELCLYVSDFEPVVRKGFLNYRLRKEEVERIVRPDVTYSFGGGTVEMSEMDKAKLGQGTIYELFDRRIRDYSARGFDQKEIQAILSADMETLFRSYRTQLTKEVVNKEQLSKLVPEKLVGMAESFLGETEKVMGVRYPASVLYGLCLQLWEIIKGGRSFLKLMPEQITSVVLENKAAYSQALRFAGELEREFGASFRVDEVAVIALFLSQANREEQEERRNPALLFAFHGQGLARALKVTVESTLKNENTFSVDLSMEQEDGATYEMLKKAALEADAGRGILAVYDLEILRQMFYMISLETGIEIRTVPLPLTRLGFDWSRRAALTSDLDLLYKAAVQDLKSLWPEMRRVIVALCATSEGLAARISDYLLQHRAAEGAEIITLSVSDRNLLREKLLEIMQGAVIQCIVGTYDPELLSIPFVPVSAVLSADPDKLPDVLSSRRKEQGRIDMEEMYDYLGEHLEYIDVRKLKLLLPGLMARLREDYGLDSDTEVGLMMHIACAVNRMAGKGVSIVNRRREEIIGRFSEDYRRLRKLLGPVEHKFHIIFPDDEFANMITIIRRL